MVRRFGTFGVRQWSLVRRALALLTGLEFITAHVVSGIRAPESNFLMQLSPGGSAGEGFLQEVIKLRPLVMHAAHPQMARKRPLGPGAPPWLVNTYPSGSWLWRSACSEPVLGLDVDTCCHLPGPMSGPLAAHWVNSRPLMIEVQGSTGISAPEPFQM